MTTSAKYESWNTEDFDGKTAFMFRKVVMWIEEHSFFNHFWREIQVLC